MAPLIVLCDLRRVRGLGELGVASCPMAAPLASPSPACLADGIGALGRGERSHPDGPAGVSPSEVLVTATGVLELLGESAS